MTEKKLQPIFFALLAAVFYAVNVPFSKHLLQDVPPTFMASFLYFGAGIWGWNRCWHYVFISLEQRTEGGTTHKRQPALYHRYGSSRYFRSYLFNARS